MSPAAQTTPGQAARHPLASRARVLLCSVFGPYAQDDEYGSRKMNPMELYHNQVTRAQGPFSLRMFHRTWGLMLIQVNLQAPTVLLDFPTLDRFVEELRMRRYDVIGIGSIPLNVLKVRKMCELIRQYQPQAQIVIGGHIANVPDLAARIDADHIVRGEGVRWFQRYLGEDDTQPLKHPQIPSGFGTRSMGLGIKDKKGSVAATLIPSVGCPLGCNFCATSAMFGGKGKFENFYAGGDELFDVMCELEAEMSVQSFFVADENFLLHRRRALRLLELMENYDKAWSLYVFSSANVLRTYKIDQLLGLGVSWVWMGLEGEESQYAKLRNIDTVSLVEELQSHGIHVLGSSIIGLETHTPDNIDAAIAYAVRHNTDFHQFMLYTPVVGTPLHQELTALGKMKDESEFHPGDIHGQSIFAYRHPHIPPGQETEFIARAFDQDFIHNGPSLMRLVRTALRGWQRHKNHPSPRIRRHIAWEAKSLSTTYAAAVWAARRYYRHAPEMHDRLSRLLGELYAEFGVAARLAANLGGPYVLWHLRREAQRLARGWTYEPATHYEANFDPRQHFASGQPPLGQAKYVTPKARPSMPLSSGVVETTDEQAPTGDDEAATAPRVKWSA